VLERKSVKHPRRPEIVSLITLTSGFPKILKHALSKTSIRCENRQVHFSNMTKTKNPKRFSAWD